MFDPVKIDFVALGPLSAQTPFQPAAKRGKNKAPLTLVLLAGQDLVFGAATRKLIGADGEAFLKKAAAAGKFKGKTSSVLEIIAPAGFSADRLLVIGMGAVKEAKAKDKEKTKDTKDADAGSESAAAWSKYTNLGGLILSRLGTGAVALVAFDPPQPPKDQSSAAADLLLGMRLRDYRFDLYKTKKNEADDIGATDVYIAVDEPSAARREAKMREAISEGVLTARSLVNEPANILYPEEFAKRAAALEKLGVEITVLDEPAMKTLGMGALLGVGQGSARESRVVIMRWRGTGAKGSKDANKTKPIAFVGKGVCFDTGGISIKGAAGMEDMKGDMAGAACVVGLMQALASRKAKVDAIGAIGLVENMPGADAQRPGDIVKSMSGQTIEVINTDAEGRLVLADVLWYVQEKYKPKFMIDLATLTGAILVALGKEYAGLFSNNDELSEKLMHVGQETGEKLWRMPLGAAYDKLIDSKFADMKNTGGRHGGSITAAQFLQRFVNDTPWAHLDIAGTGMDSPSNDINQSWGSGWGVRLLDRLVAEYYES